MITSARIRAALKDTILDFHQLLHMTKNTETWTAMAPEWWIPPVDGLGAMAICVKLDYHRVHKALEETVWLVVVPSDGTELIGHGRSTHWLRSQNPEPDGIFFAEACGNDEEESSQEIAQVDCPKCLHKYIGELELSNDMDRIHYEEEIRMLKGESESSVL